MQNDNNIIYSVGDINIGEIVYRIEDSYNELYRINNIYKDGVDIIKDTRYGGGKNKYVDYNTLIEDYIRVKPHGYVEFTVMEIQELTDGILYDDLRISYIAKDLKTGDLVLTSTGLLLTPVYDIYGDYNNLCFTGVDAEDSPNCLHGGTKESSKYRVAIAYYFGDSSRKIMSFFDDVFEKVLRDLVYKFMKKKPHPIYETELSYWADKLYNNDVDIPDKQFTKYILDGLVFKRPIHTLLEYHNGYKCDMYDDFTIADDMMFVHHDIIASLNNDIGFPDYPYVVNKYELHMDLNSIKNPYVLLYTCDYDEDDDMEVFVIMTLSNDDRINKHISNTSDGVHFI